ncbi:Short-chain dehydrogenase/reductase SDR [Candidatus Promineifilum breve]|uniref:Short-chain dehydrogenase/reductase SDR n=1 Tax=Candidatus Promineifilum breve TaxID=1806508 RepID=A0A160T6B6_9CHLR|nr:SDR family oxidoreductase [Candidatus Promineifilum breve]CUS05941.1 Short-chain dehydrogenase/reductase SDR [Candidatus Promineifilum breve]
MKVNNKVIVVTGAGSGMGRALVLALLKRGARVAAADLNETTLNETYELAGPQRDKVSRHVVNVSDRAAVAALPAAVIAAHGAVDGIINNAGIIQPFVRLNELHYDAIERVLNVNLYGVIYMTKAFLPHLLTRPAAHIVNVSSMGGFFPVPGQSLYGASKAGVKLLTEGLFSELTETNVRVTVVFPGAIATNISQNSGVVIAAPAAATDDAAQSFPTTSAEDAAEIILNGIENDAFQVYIGNDAKMMNWLYRLSPKRATRFMYNRMKQLLG